MRFLSSRIIASNLAIPPLAAALILPTIRVASGTGVRRFLRPCAAASAPEPNGGTGDS